MSIDPCTLYRDRYKLWAAAFIQVAFLAGATYGFVNLEKILVRDGYWTDDASTEEMNFGLVYTVGSWCNKAGKLFIGVYLDRFGVKVTTVAGCIMCAIGLVFCAISTTSYNLVYPAFILVSLGGPAIQLGTQTISDLFTNKAMVMSSLTWSLQLSTLWFMVVNVLNIEGINETLLFMCYATIAAVLGIQCWWIYPWKFKSAKRLQEEDQCPVTGWEVARQSMLITTGRYPEDFLETGSLWQMMFSIDYILLNCWFSGHILYLEFWVMTVGTQTELMTGENMDEQFTIALCTVSSFGIIIGLAMDIYGFSIVVLANIAFSMGASFCITSPKIVVQWLGFILYVLSRVTTSGLFFSFIGINFGFRYFGTLTGVCILISSCISLLQYLCLDIVDYDLGGNYNGMNIFMAFWVGTWGGIFGFWLLPMEVKSIFTKKESVNLLNGASNEQYVIDKNGVKA